MYCLDGKSGVVLLQLVQPFVSPVPDRPAHLEGPVCRRIGEEKLDANGVKRYPARRWVVELTLAWLSKCRAILVRYDKKGSNYVGLVQLACALLCYRRQHRLLF